MIISHQHKFIFFPIPKTGTHSIRFALRPFLGKEDEEHVGLFHHSKFNIEEFKDRNNGHFSVQEIKPYLSKEIWDSYYKFTFVRNPYDRFVSACVFKHPLIQNDPNNIEKARILMKMTAEKELKKPSFFYKPQLEYLKNEMGETAINFIGKTEKMQEDFNEICAKIQVFPPPLEKINTSKHNSFEVYYDDELKNLISLLYKEDISIFKYEF